MKTKPPKIATGISPKSGRSYQLSVKQFINAGKKGWRLNLNKGQRL